MVLTYKQKFNKRYGFAKNEPHSIREIAKKAGIRYRNALKIVEKGEGAYRTNPTSVRNHIVSPREWGIARLYSAVMGGPAARIDKDLLK
jgi:hypothetical protein